MFQLLRISAFKRPVFAILTEITNANLNDCHHSIFFDFAFEHAIFFKFALARRPAYASKAGFARAKPPAPKTTAQCRSASFRSAAATRSSPSARASAARRAEYM